jgi:DNA-binding response OmpR family regulator
MEREVGHMDRKEVILVVDDEEPLRGYITQCLDSDEYRVLTARNGVEALAILHAHPVDLIVADIAMPRMNGYQLYERVVENPEWVAIPFIFLTGRALDSDIRYAKELGVDDYLTKPFMPDDLLAAVRGKLLRMRRWTRFSARPVPPPAVSSSVLTLGELWIDTDQYQVLLSGRPIKLSAREFRLLECLARRPREVVPLQELVKATHALDTDPVEAGGLLRPLIRSLRRKLGYNTGDMGCIQSVRGVGYRLIPPGNPAKVSHPNGLPAGAHGCEVMV